MIEFVNIIISYIIQTHHLHTEAQNFSECYSLSLSLEPSHSLSAVLFPCGLFQNPPCKHLCCRPWMRMRSLSHFSCDWFFTTLWTAAHQASLSMGFSWQEHWSGSPCLPGYFPDPGSSVLISSSKHSFFFFLWLHL